MPLRNPPVKDLTFDIQTRSPPTINVAYEMFHLKNVVVHFIGVYQKNDEVAAKDIRVRILANRFAYDVDPISFDDDSINSLYLDQDNAVASPQIANVPSAQHFGYQSNPAGGQRVTYPVGFVDLRIELTLRSAAGTNQTMSCRVGYEQIQG